MPGNARSGVTVLKAGKVDSFSIRMRSAYGPLAVRKIPYRVVG